MYGQNLEERNSTEKKEVQADRARMKAYSDAFMKLLKEKDAVRTNKGNGGDR